ncbi:MAG: hypothetical protein JO253_04750 [Alphaproteobacteria bacterium]|nr:hypothetical protein [Alphaproteobacteria bacterium]
MFYKQPNMNAALKIVMTLGAYCPTVKVTDEKALVKMKQSSKHRTRPMLGRGNYGASLKAHFDKIRFEQRNAA